MSNGIKDEPCPLVGLSEEGGPPPTTMRAQVRPVFAGDHDALLQPTAPILLRRRSPRQEPVDSIVGQFGFWRGRHFCLPNEKKAGKNACPTKLGHCRRCDGSCLQAESLTPLVQGKRSAALGQRPKPCSLKDCENFDRFVGTERFLRRRHSRRQSASRMGRRARPRKAVWCRPAQVEADTASTNHPEVA